MIEATWNESEEVNNERAEDGRKEMKKCGINEDGKEGKERIGKMIK
jgi:hypothetical protein